MPNNTSQSQNSSHAGTGRASLDPPAPNRRRRAPIRGPVTIAAALAGGLAIWCLAEPGAGLQLVAGPQQVGPTSIMVATVLVGAAGWLLRVLLRRLDRGRRIWQAVAATILVLSLLGPPASGASGAALVVLELLHLIVGGIMLVGFGGVFGREEVDDARQ